MKPFLLVLLVSIIIINRCDNNLPIVGQKHKQTSSEKLTDRTLFVCFTGRFIRYEENRIIDNKDGTISLAEVTVQGTDYCPLPFGKTESIKVKYYIKKCIQGQVYRSAQNDCKGTGTAANYYGAQKLQMCPTTNTCTDSESSVMSSCINDTTAVKTWKPGGFESGATIKIVSNYLKTRSDEIPVSNTDYYWSQIAGATLANIDGATSTSGSSIVNFGYVLCFNNKS